MKLPTIVHAPYTPKRNPRHGMPCEYRCKTRGCSEGPNEHTHTLDNIPAPENGSGWLERKSSGEIIYHTPWTKVRRPWKMAALKARVETPTEALKRMHKELDGDTNRIFAANDGMIMTRGTRFWALCERADAASPAIVVSKNLDISGRHRRAVLIDPEFHLALKRALVVSETVRLSGEAGAITLRSVDNTASDDRGNGAASFEETVGALTSEPFSIALNGSVIEQVLGCWPLTMWIGPTTVVFEPASREWRFVLAAMR